jgi:predicted glycoside hydrolase/deacetylase ChbG (UPF0249 family)
MPSDPPPEHPRRIIVNADDFGYFEAVSRGILAAADAGRVTATGVLVNGPAFARNAPALRDRPELDTGLHLNLTWGDPVSADLRRALASGGGHMPGPARVAATLLTGRLPLGALVAEVQAQIDRALDAGLVLRFLNGHEHIHMLPRLYPRVQALAEEYGIPFVRHVGAEWRGTLSGGPGGLLRALVLWALGRLGQRPPRGPRLIGTAVSGRLSLAYLAGRLPRLAPGQAYELMCHPGFDDPNEVRDPRLAAFHRWGQELALLTGTDFAALCERAGVLLTRFRDLPAGGLAP